MLDRSLARSSRAECMVSVHATSRAGSVRHRLESIVTRRSFGIPVEGKSTRWAARSFTAYMPRQGSELQIALTTLLLMAQSLRGTVVLDLSVLVTAHHFGSHANDR